MKATVATLETQLNILSDQVTTLQETTEKNKETSERIEQNQDKDREDFSEFKNRVGHLEQEFVSLKEIVNQLPNQARDKMAEVAAPMMEEAQDLKEVIIDKKVVAIDTQKVNQQRSFWQKFSNWWKQGWK